MRITFKILMAAVILSTPLLTGCNDGGPSSRVFVKNGTTKRLRVAVLPFDNVSKDAEAGRVVTNTVITYLLSTGYFDVVEPGMVYAAMGAENIRLTDGITVDSCQKLQPTLKADAYIMGMVEEFGEVRVGSDSYPSISISARLVNAHTADILWAATISKTGADSVKVFDIGRVSSLGKLAKRAAGDLVSSLAKSREDVSKGTAAPVTETVAVDSEPVTANVSHGETVTVANPPAVVGPATVPSTTPDTAPDTAPPAVATPGANGTPAAGGKSADGSAFPQDEFTGLLKNVGNATLGEVSYKKHFHDTAEADYRLTAGGKVVQVKLVDYLSGATSLKFLQGYNPDARQGTFESVPAYTGESDFGYYHMDLAIGRFGVFLRGPKDTRADIESIGKGLVALLK